MPYGLVTGDEVCLALMQAAQDNLPPWQEALGLPAIKRWVQLPQSEAAPTLPTPYALVTTPGLAGVPLQRGGDYWATWRVVVAVFDRGPDHDSTAANIRKWAAAMRAACLASPGLGMKAQVTWVTEEYSLAPDRNEARTLGGCAVAFDVSIPQTTPLMPPGPGPSTDPAVIRTDQTITVKPPE